MSYTKDTLTNDKIKFSRLISAYEEAVKNNIISIETQPPSSNRALSDFSTLIGIKFTGGTTLGNPIAATNTVSACLQACHANNACNGALYEENLLVKKCQLYSELPKTGTSYVYDTSSNTIIYNSYGSIIPPVVLPAKPSFKDTLNYKIKIQLEDQLTALGLQTNANIVKMTPDNRWSVAIDGLDDAHAEYLNFQNEKKINEDIKSKLRNSGLDVIKTKTKYILFIVLLLILSAIYVRDFNFSITVFIILFLMISVYGSIFLGAFLLVLIVLYLVYYAY
jgi:hypothetical protein